MLSDFYAWLQDALRWLGHTAVLDLNTAVIVVVGTFLVVTEHWRIALPLLVFGILVAIILRRTTEQTRPTELHLSSNVVPR